MREPPQNYEVLHNTRSSTVFSCLDKRSDERVAIKVYMQSELLAEDLLLVRGRCLRQFLWRYPFCVLRECE